MGIRVPRPNEYCEIQQSLQNTLGATKTVPHLMGTLDYCMFLTQDITPNGLVVIPFPSVAARIFCPDGVGQRTKTAAPVTDQEAPALPHAYDLMLVTAHSVLDVGPVVLGNTRKAPGQIFRPRIWLQGRKAYRSLHRKVEFNGPNETEGGYTVRKVVLTHLLRTTDVQVFITPSSDPYDGSAPVRVGWRPLSPTPSPNAVELVLARVDGDPIANMGFSFDVMVVSQPPVGHSVVYHDNRSYAAPGLPPPIAGAPVSKRPDYRACYSGPDTDDGNPMPVVHNDREQASMLLLGYKSGPMPLGPLLHPNVPFIAERAYSSLPTYAPDKTSLIFDTNTRNGDVIDILVVSPHSIFTSRVVPPPPPPPP